MEISKAKIHAISALRLRRHRRDRGLFVAEGVKCVLETLPYFDLDCLVLTHDAQVPKEALAGVDNELIYMATERQMGQLSGLSTPSDMVAVYRMPELKVPAPQAISGELVLALDGVQDPGNLGTILRAADWFGVRHIVASRLTADIFNPKSVQATMGAIGRVAISYTDDLPGYIQQYRRATGLPVYGTMLEGTDMYGATLSACAMIVMGNEGNGLTPQVRELVDSPLLIPPFPADAQTVESLNVAMATAVTLAEFRRRQASISLKN